MDYFVAMSDSFADKPAIVFGEKILTYAMLNARSDYVANAILENDVAPEEVIPLVFERCDDIIVAMLGVLKAGCAFLPISAFTPCARKKFIFDDSQARLVITNDPNLVRAVNTTIKIISTDSPLVQKKPPLPKVTSNQLAYVMYTSGSTGNPKGVLIEHGSMMNLFLSLISELHLTADEKILALTDYTFDISLIELLMPLMLGATIVLTEQGTVGDGLKIKHYLKQHEITLMQATPITWEILLKQGWQNEGHIKMLVGGEKFSTRLAGLLEYCKGNVWNMYGPTETSMWSLFYHLKGRLYTESVPLGKPLANTTIAILGEDLNPVVAGNQGELYIGGKGLARGYLNNLTLTQEKFIDHPDTGERFYKTGDFVIEHDQSTLCFIGRIDEQLKFGGIRIEAGEIEHIIEQVPFVKKAVVKVHEQTGYYKSLAAYVEIAEDKLLVEDFSEKDREIADYFKDIYNKIYDDAENYQTENINVCGWQSSFTGELFSPEELKESGLFMNKIIDESDLSHVLEIGCGTGSLLFEHIHKVQRYTAVEISNQAIEYIKGRLSEEQKAKVVFKTQSAIDIHEQREYSCVIVNSVIQYFPSIHYLMTALKQFIAATQEGGTIIIGDVRSLELLDIFLLEKMRCHAEDTDQLRLNSLYYKSRESEIVLSPRFFYALKSLFPDISHVDIAVKHGTYKNELNYFRYDAILYIKKPITYQTPLIIHYESALNKDSLIKIGEENKEKVVVIRQVPNVFVHDLLHKLDEKFSDYTAGFSINHHDADFEAKNLHFLLADEINSHEKWVLYDRENSLSELEIHFYPKIGQEKVRCFISEEDVKLNTAVREPFNPWLQKFCVDKIKKTVNQHLVSWVAPSTYILVEKWPITVNGKLDKKRLQLPMDVEVSHDANSTLVQLQKIWKNVTGERVLIDKDFSMQGLSSLYVHFFLATINEKFGLNIHYSEIHQYNTLIKLADYIEHLSLLTTS